MLFISYTNPRKANSERPVTYVVLIASTTSYEYTPVFQTDIFIKTFCIFIDENVFFFTHNKEHVNFYKYLLASKSTFNNFAETDVSFAEVQ